MRTSTRSGSQSLLRALKALPGELREGVPLASLTTFRIGGPAWAVFTPSRWEALVEGVRLAQSWGTPWRVVGGGSKLLFSDQGFPGLVILTRNLRGCRREDGLVVAEAGLRLRNLVELGFCQLAGIPGTVGGAVVMNSGTRYGQIGDRVEWVELLTPEGELVRWGRGECEFSYRNSRIREQRWAVVRVGLRPANSGPPPALILAERRAGQPVGLPSAGCVFRNPPDAPAGWLIDRAGLKGAREGGAMVSPKHANFIVNLGHARASEVLRLVDRVQRQVFKAFRVWLKLELEVVRG